ncbi:MAG: ribonuclease Z [Flavobacteriales bacterium]|jgi:AAA15 family ATPase/GTPase
MKINAHDNFVVVKENSNDLENFVFLLKPLLPFQLKDKNLIIDLLDNKLMSLKDLLLFQNISDAHKEANKSFVIVNDALNANSLPEEIMVVPTLQEAEDMIEMEEIERELEF